MYTRLTADLFGRAAETARVRGVLAVAREEAAGLLLLGPPGIGRTTLLAAAAAQAREEGRRVLPIEPGDLQNDVEYGLDRIRRMAAGTPVVLLADDLQDFDAAALARLGRIARRLDPERVALLGAFRGTGVPSALAVLPTLLLRPLDARSAGQLLASRPGALRGRGRVQILRAAAGNPGAIVALGNAVAGERSPHPAGLTTASWVWGRAENLAGLPAKTRELLLYLAVGPREGSLRTIAAALGGHRPEQLVSWAPAERAALVGIARDRVTFNDPLTAAVIYATTPTVERCRVHAALAEVCEAESEAHAWHLAALLEAGQPVAIEAVERAADRAGRSGAWFVSALALEIAAESGPHRAEQARLYLKALMAADRVGDPDWVEDLHQRVRNTAGGDPRVLALAAGTAALTMSRSGEQRAAFALILRTLDEPGLDRPVQLSLLGAAACAAFESGLGEHREMLREQLAGPALPSGPQQSDPFDGLVRPESLTDGVELAAAVVDPATARAFTSTRTGSRDQDPVRLLVQGRLAWFADDSQKAVDALRLGISLIGAQDSLTAFPSSLTTLVCALVESGRWDEAQRLLDEVASGLRSTHGHRPAIQIEGLKAWLRALTGDPEGAQGLLDGVVSGLDLTENRATALILTRASAEIAAAIGDSAGTYLRLRSLFGEDGAPLHHFLAPRVIGELAEAAYRAGYAEEAATVLRAVKATIGQPSVRMTLLLHQAEALIGEPGQAEEHFGLAGGNSEADQWPLERARARLRHAQWLRRRRRPMEARQLLEPALATFTRLGAAALAEQAQGELRASGTARPSGSPGRLQELTPQEEQIVRLAAQGMRNREIADQLFLSPRTIGYHLYKSYPKLGVSQRHQLRDIVEAAPIDPRVRSPHDNAR
jgi:DNA-binding CsgD family transcriptional regulator